MMIKMNLKQVLKVCTGSSEYCDEPSSPSYKRKGISWPGERVSAFQKGLCSMELVAFIRIEGRSAGSRADLQTTSYAPVWHAASRIFALPLYFKRIPKIAPMCSDSGYEFFSLLSFLYSKVEGPSLFALGVSNYTT
jgi:hypothetical protein